MNIKTENIDLKSFLEGHIHFIGCGGAGMVGLAIILHEKGYKISGSDLTESNSTSLLKKKGVNVSIGHRLENLPGNTKKLLIVRSSAVRDDNPEFAGAILAGHSSLFRGELLAKVAEMYKKPVAIAGSHGKTSVTAMLVHILRELNFNPGYMIGGKVNTWKAPASAGKSDIFITEADESDGTAALLKTELGIVTNVDDDHCWSVGGIDALYKNFAKFADQAGYLIYGQSETADSIFKLHPEKKPLDLKSLRAKLQKQKKLAYLKEWCGYQLENALLAVEAAVKLGISRKNAERAIVSFPGVERRMTTRFKNDKITVFEDYAHHPTEIAAALEALRKKFPGYKLLVVFQPHRHARLERYLEKFADELRKADEVIVTPLFAAWTEKGKYTSADLAAKIGPKAKYVDSDWKKLATDLSKTVSAPEILAILGAGDIEKLIPPLTAELKNKYQEI